MDRGQSENVALYDSAHVVSNKFTTNLELYLMSWGSLPDGSHVQGVDIIPPKMDNASNNMFVGIKIIATSQAISD